MKHNLAADHEGKMPRAFLVKRSKYADISGTHVTTQPTTNCHTQFTMSDGCAATHITKDQCNVNFVNPKDYALDPRSTDFSKHLQIERDAHCCFLPPLSGLYLPRKYYLLQKNLFPHEDAPIDEIALLKSANAVAPSLATAPIIPSPVGDSPECHDDIKKPAALSTNVTWSTIPTENKCASRDFKRHQCHVCMKWFKRASSLSNHRLIHKNSKSFKCEQCDMSFLRKSDLGKHVVIHSGSKPYQCETCGKRFSQSSNMLTHQRRHSGVRPYSCTFCGKSFYRKVDVRRHSSVHREC